MRHVRNLYFLAGPGVLVAPPGRTVFGWRGRAYSTAAVESSESSSYSYRHPATAERIVARRDELGGFSDVVQLLEVSGIGPARFAELESRVGV